MDGSKSTKNFNSSGDSNDYSGSCKVGAGVNVYTNNKYVVGSNDKTENTNSKYGVDYTEGAKCFLFTGCVGDYVGDYTKRG